MVANVVVYEAMEPGSRGATSTKVNSAIPVAAAIALPEDPGMPPERMSARKRCTASTRRTTVATRAATHTHDGSPEAAGRT